MKVAINLNFHIASKEVLDMVGTNVVAALRAASLLNLLLLAISYGTIVFLNCDEGMSPAAPTPAPTPGTGLQHGLRTPKIKSAYIIQNMLIQFSRVASGSHPCIRRVLIASGLYRRTLRIHTHFHIYIPLSL